MLSHSPGLYLFHLWFWFPNQGRWTGLYHHQCGWMCRTAGRFHSTNVCVRVSPHTRTSTLSSSSSYNGFPHTHVQRTHVHISVIFITITIRPYIQILSSPSSLAYVVVHTVQQINWAIEESLSLMCKRNPQLSSTRWVLCWNSWFHGVIPCVMVRISSLRHMFRFVGRLMGKLSA